MFHGWADAGISGLTESSAHPTLAWGQDVEAYPHAVAKATDVLRQAGIEGPYLLAIGPEGYTRIVQTTERGAIPSSST